MFTFISQRLQHWYWGGLIGYGICRINNMYNVREQCVPAVDVWFDIDSAYSSMSLLQGVLAEGVVGWCVSVPHGCLTGLLIHLSFNLRQSPGDAVALLCLHNDFKITGKCINRGRHMVHPITGSSLRTQLINWSLLHFPIRLVERTGAEEGAKLKNKQTKKIHELHLPARGSI